MPKAKKRATTAKAKTPAKIDPNVAARRAYEHLNRKWLDMAAAHDGTEKTGRRSKAWAESHGITESDVETASDLALAAGWKMAETEPTTIAGAAAMLRYLTKGPNCLFEASKYGEVIWLLTAFQTLERSLAKMARGSRLAA